MWQFRTLLRMGKLAHRPPSEARVKLFLGVIALCFLIAGYEWLIGFPEWLAVDFGANRVRPVAN